MPLHLQIRGVLEKQIASGSLSAGARLPTEAELREQYGVSRATATRVLNDLTEAGLAVRYRRRGTFVSDGARHQNLLSFVTPHSLQKGVPGRHKVLSAKVVQAVDALIEMPGVSSDTPVVEIVRLKLDMNDQPTSLEQHVILFSAVPKILDEDLEHLVSYDYFQKMNVPIATSRVYIDPVVLGASEADLLDSEPGEAAFRRRRHTRDAAGRTIEVTAIIVRPGSVQFYIEQPIRNPNGTSDADRAEADEL